MKLKHLKRRERNVRLELEIALRFGSKARIAELAKLLSDIVRQIKLNS